MANALASSLARDTHSRSSPKILILSMSKPCQVLMLSKDTSLLASQQGFGNALARHRRYAEKLNALAPGSQLRILTLSSALNPERKYMEKPTDDQGHSVSKQI